MTPLPPRVRKTTPSAKLVYFHLSVFGPARPFEIAPALGSTERTVAAVLRDMLDAGVVDRRVDPADARMVIYSAADDSWPSDFAADTNTTTTTSADAAPTAADAAPSTGMTNEFYHGN